MIIINHISMGLSICALLAVAVGWSRVRTGKSGSEKGLLLLLLYLFGLVASVFASALSIAVGGFWIYPFTLGLAIFALAYMNYRINLSRDD